MNNRLSRRVTRLALVGLLASAGGLGGCISQKAYDEVVTENRALKSRNVELQGRIDDLGSLESSLRSQLDSMPSATAGLEDAHALTLQQLNEARRMIADLESRLDGMEFARLDPVTDDALRQLAERYPNLIRYDAERGMIRFASDLTFASGSAEVQAGAKKSLSTLAGILKSSAATGYDVRVVGHTDSQPISSKTRERFPTNMHLSAARAIAVRRELISLGVPADRMMAAGWGEYRPLVPNSADGNTPANRRVEIYLFAADRAAGASSGSPTGVGAAIDRDALGGSSYEPTK